MGIISEEWALEFFVNETNCNLLIQVFFWEQQKLSSIHTQKEKYSENVHILYPKNKTKKKIEEVSRWRLILTTFFLCSCSTESIFAELINFILLFYTSNTDYNYDKITILYYIQYTSHTSFSSIYFIIGTT